MHGANASECRANQMPQRHSMEKKTAAASWRATLTFRHFEKESGCFKKKFRILRNADSEWENG